MDEHAHNFAAPPPSKEERETGLYREYWETIYGEGAPRPMDYGDGLSAARGMATWGKSVDEMDAVLGDITSRGDFYRGFKAIVEGLYSGEMVRVPNWLNEHTGRMGYAVVPRGQAEALEDEVRARAKEHEGSGLNLDTLWGPEG